MSIVKEMERLERIDEGIGEKAFMGDAVLFARVMRTLKNKELAYMLSVLSYKMTQEIEAMKEDLKKTLHEEIEERVKA
ncbi:MAG: hypothetical protein HYW25_04045 [Candidatus Aenigmarchaeota archaeon]|nr:hypothetical protein [Candidatus Aenigmarchaeota archaeon]